MYDQVQQPVVNQPYGNTFNQTQQSQALAAAIQQLSQSKQNTTPVSGSSNMMANALNTFQQQGAGQGANLPGGQWTGANGMPSGNWMDSPLGKQLGGMFKMGGPQGPAGAGGASATPVSAPPSGSMVGGFGDGSAGGAAMGAADASGAAAAGGDTLAMGGADAAGAAAAGGSAAAGAGAAAAGAGAAAGGSAAAAGGSDAFLALLALC